MLILGTTSPRRIDLFKTFNLPFIQIASHFDEDSIPLHLPPDEYVSVIAEKKGELLKQDHPDATILTLDTTVYFEGNIINKPSNPHHAVQTLLMFSDKSHDVWTAVSVRKKNDIYTKAQKSVVHFQKLNKNQIENYVKVFHPMDKAGSYSILDASGILVRAIEGDFYNVLGFPTSLVQELLSKVGIYLWDYLKK